MEKSINFSPNWINCQNITIFHPVYANTIIFTAPQINWSHPRELCFDYNADNSVSSDVFVFASFVQLPAPWERTFVGHSCSLFGKGAEEDQTSNNFRPHKSLSVSLLPTSFSLRNGSPFNINYLWALQHHRR